MRSATRSPKKTIRISALTIAVSTILVFGGIEGAIAQQPRAGAAYQSPVSLTRSALRDFFLSRHSDSATRSAATGALEMFYANRDFSPVWTGSAEAVQAGRQVQSILMQADRQGLDHAAYTPAALQGNDPPAPGKDAADYDASLTEALLRYASDLRVGRVRPGDIYRDVGLPASDFDASAALGLALKNGALNAFLSDLAPAHPGYRGLEAALARYREISERGGWPSLTGAGESNAKLLVARLAMEDSIFANNKNPTPGETQEAIVRYQKRNGLAADGRLGAVTLSALNVPVSVRIQQIVANMERWRWISSPFEHRYIAVNIPDQSLDFIQDGRVLLHSRVIVGRTSSPTPILRTVTSELVVNPPWNVPGDIAARALLPHLKRNPNYLATRNMVVVNGPEGDPRGATIPWKDVPADPFPYAIRQLPHSAMGILMLDSPNDFDVYLHDTPGKAPFQGNDREVSNGCIRVQDIMPLASLALTNDASAGLRQINDAISSRQTRRISLGDSLPIYMLYWTAIADADGNVGFRPDRYNRDPQLIAALENVKVASQ